MNATTASEAPTDIAALYWDKLAFYLRHAFSLFGDPAQLARRLWLSAREHKQFCDYIRPLEEIVRRIVFIMALELAPMTHPPAPERKFRARLAMPANAGASFDMDAPTTWRVSFRCGPPASSRHTAPCAAQADAERTTLCRLEAGGPAGRVSSAPSAERLEALLRVVDNPDRYAAALARQLARKPATAHAYTANIKPKLAHKTGYITLSTLTPLVAEAFQRHLHRKLDALLPNTS